MFNNIAFALQNDVRSVAISGHIRPDGDCTGSCLAMYNYIKENYSEIEVTVFLEPIQDVFRFLNRSQEINSQYDIEKVFDLFICLDCGDAQRLGQAVKYFENAKKTICIDHHISNDSFADINYIYPKASSTCELVFELFDVDKITKGIAECLYLGIVHDTGVFQFSSTSAKTMGVAGILMEKGVEFTRIIDETFYQKTFNQNRVLGQALLKSNLRLDNKCIVSIITREDMKSFHVEAKDLDGVVNQLRVTKGIEVAVFIYETKGSEFKVSMRSNGLVNVAQIAAKLGGGGHIKAAGVTLNGTIESVTDIILTEIEKQIIWVIK